MKNKFTYICKVKKRIMAQTKFEKLNPPREDGFPKVNEITRFKDENPYRVKPKDPNFDKPLSELTKEY